MQSLSSCLHLYVKSLIHKKNLIKKHSIEIKKNIKGNIKKKKIISIKNRRDLLEIVYNEK